MLISLLPGVVSGVVASVLPGVVSGLVSAVVTSVSFLVISFVSLSVSFELGCVLFFSSVSELVADLLISLTFSTDMFVIFFSLFDINVPVKLIVLLNLPLILYVLLFSSYNILSNDKFTISILSSILIFNSPVNFSSLLSSYFIFPSILVFTSVSDPDLLVTVKSPLIGPVASDFSKSVSDCTLEESGVGSSISKSIFFIFSNSLLLIPIIPSTGIPPISPFTLIFPFSLGLVVSNSRLAFLPLNTTPSTNILTLPIISSSLVS